MNGKAAAWVFGFYTMLKLVDLAFQGKLGMLLEGSWESLVFIFELLISALLPAVLLTIQKVRRSRAGLTACAVMVVIGFVLNRINISGIAMIRATGSDYFPSLIEISISLSIVSLAILVFLFFVERFKVYDKEAGTKMPLHSPPVFDRPSAVWTDEPLYGGIKRNSLLFIMGAVIAFAFLPADARNGASPIAMPVQRARIADALLIDGNRADMVVLFDHEMHKEKNGDDESCILCHHLRKPLDKYTPCADCHKDMQLETYIFDHTFHQTKLEGNDGCIKCHTNPMLPKIAENITECKSCHTDMRIEGTVITISAATQENYAPGYIDAMHGLCITCHQQKKVELNNPRHDECATCHRELPQNILDKINLLYGEKLPIKSIKPNK